MTTEKEYPLIENLDRVKRKKFESPEQRLHAIVTVLHEEATTRYTERDSDRTVPVEMQIQSHYRWDVAGCTFTDKEVLNLMRKKEITNTVTQSHLLCVSLHEVFYDMAANLFYSFYSIESGSGLTADENNEIIKAIFGEQFDKLNQAFHEWFMEFIPKMLMVHPSWTDVDPVAHTERQIKHYRTAYKDAFFMPHIEEAIQNVISQKS